MASALLLLRRKASSAYGVFSGPSVLEGFLVDADSTGRGWGDKMALFLVVSHGQERPGDLLVPQTSHAQTPREQGLSLEHTVDPLTKLHILYADAHTARGWLQLRQSWLDVSLQA